jgi:hypothetical protein
VIKKAIKNITTMFEGRRLLIATKHKKESVIAPLFERELGVECYTLPDLDTDLLGTFSGEIERKEDPVTTANSKCDQAISIAGGDLVLASEGSFGPHPTMFFAPCDDEILVLKDLKNELQFTARHISTSTNFDGSEIKTKKELIEFADRVHFPSHGLIIRKSKDSVEHIVKGIHSIKLLTSVFHDYIQKFGSVYLETDMRAMHNPMRLKVIEEATIKLLEIVKSKCQSCQTPGFTVIDIVPGLPCEICGYPTKSTLSLIYGCKKCDYKSEKKYPKGKFVEDAMYCDICNP